MKWFTKGLPFVVAAAVLALSTSHPVSGDEVKHVIVANTPLPVTGNATVSGTVTAQQGGAWNVGIAGTPSVNVSNAVSLASGTQVKVAADTPLPVTVTQTAAQIVRLGGSATSPQWGMQNFGFVVPAGKRLNIQYINGQGTIDNGKVFIRLTLHNSTSFHQYILPLEDQGRFSNQSLFAGSAQVTVTAEENENISWECSPSDGTQNGGCSFEVVGTLVDGK